MKDLYTPGLKSNRILVALDASTRGHAALQAAVRLALNSSAELQGLFIEDQDLVRLAGLPFAQEVDLASSLVRELKTGNMERALRVAAEESRLAFARALKQVDLTWTFRVIQGDLVNASLAAAGKLDLLILGQRGRSPHDLAKNYLPKRKTTENCVVAVCDGTLSSFLAMELAYRHAAATSHQLSVWVLEENGGNVATECFSWLQTRGISANLDQVLDPCEDAIVDLARQWQPAALFVNRDSKYVNDTQICRLVNECDCPLVLC